MKKITKIDLWSMDSTVADILVPAIYDEFYIGEKSLYNNIRVYKNANVEYFIEKKLVNSYQHVVLFLDDNQPVRIVFLRCKEDDLESSVQESFADKCLPSGISLEDLVAEGKMSVAKIDLKQKLGKEIISKQLGSCGTLGLLISMLGGAKTADGTGQKNIKGDIFFDPKFELVVRITLDEFEVAIRHVGLFRYELADKVDTGEGVIQDERWIIIQDSFRHDEFRHIVEELNK